MPFAIIAPFRPHSQCSVMRCVHIAAVQTLNRPRVCSHRLRQPKVFETSEAFHRCVLIAGFDRRRKRAALLRSLDVRPFISEYLVFVFHILFVEPRPNKSPEPMTAGRRSSASRRRSWSFRIGREIGILSMGSFRLHHSQYFFTSVSASSSAVRFHMASSRSSVLAQHPLPFWTVAPSRLRILRRSFSAYRMVCT